MTCGGRAAGVDDRAVMQARIPGKKQTLLSYLSRGVTMLHLDARRPGVIVPPQYANDAHLRLNLSYRYGIPDFDINDKRVQATLSFGGRHFQCILPWESIFGITSSGTGDGQVWPEDLPVEVMHTIADTQDRTAPPPARARLKAVQSEEAASQREEKPAEQHAGRPHLRLVR